MGFHEEGFNREGEGVFENSPNVGGIGGDFTACFRQLQQKTTLLSGAVNTMTKIKELSIIGANTSLLDLNRKKDDNELVMMFFEGIQQETTSEAENIKEVSIGRFPSYNRGF